jgi:hypothetical protein
MLFSSDILIIIEPKTLILNFYVLEMDRWWTRSSGRGVRAVASWVVKRIAMIFALGLYEMPDIMPHP